jgi:hypothetical protein
LVEHLHGKEGVSGSSPEEGFAKVPETGLFGSICRLANVRYVWSPLWSLQLDQAVSIGPFWGDEEED